MANLRQTIKKVKVTNKVKKCFSVNENGPLAAIEGSYKNSNASARKNTALKRARAPIIALLNGRFPRAPAIKSGLI